MLLDKLKVDSHQQQRSRNYSMHKMNPARVDREDERRMLPCRSFLDGFCPRGHRCRFYHPVPSAIPTVIRVPNLPSSFQQNTQFGQYPVHGGHHSMFSLSPTSSRSFMGLSPKMSSAGLGGMSTPVASSSSRYMGGMNGFSHGFGGRSVPIPVSPTYSEYEMAYAQEMELQKEKERRASAPTQETEESSQNTVFSHIDWKEFLTPGARPPPPTHVPYMSNSPGKSPTDQFDSLETLIRSAGTTKITSPVNLTAKPRTFLQDRLLGQPQSEYGHPTVTFSTGRTVEIPVAVSQQPLPHHSKYRDSSSPPMQQQSVPTTSRTLSAKEELQLKVKEIARELASEPAQHTQSLDTFFRNYTFQSMPTAPSSEQDLLVASDDVSPAHEDDQDQQHHGDCSETSSSVDADVSAAFDVQLAAASAAVFNPKVPAFSCSSDSGICPSSGSGDSASSMEGNKSDPEETPSEPPNTSS